MIETITIIVQTLFVCCLVIAIIYYWREIVLFLGITAGVLILGMAMLFPSALDSITTHRPYIFYGLLSLLGSLVLLAWTHSFTLWIAGLIRNIRALVSATRDARKFVTANLVFETFLLPDALYFNHFKLDQWKKRYSDLYNKAKMLSRLRRGSKGKPQQPIHRFMGYYDQGDGIRAEYNAAFVAKELSQCSTLFNDIEGRSLDDQQRVAVITAEDNNLVIAGAGTGKTSTIVGRVRYLVERYHADPARILVLSFTKKSAEELRKRIGSHCEISTFHKLGKDIITAARQEKLWVYEAHDLKKDLDSIWRESLSDEKFLQDFCQFVFYYPKPFRSNTEATSVEDVVKMNKRCHNARVPLLALNHKRLRSHEEVRIYNFLLLHQVNFRYEEPYEYHTGNSQYAQYMPDFTIYQNSKRYYLEHFGIDSKGNTAPGVNRKQYHQRMDWKRGLHRAYGTSMIETYSYEIGSPNYAETLRKKLEKYKIELNPMSADELIQAMNKVPRSMEDFMSLLTEFISLYKSNCVSTKDLYVRVSKEKDDNDKARNMAFVRVFEKMLDGYEEVLTRKQRIDFGDMILKAVETVKSGKYKPLFAHIIVDEFQDMSLGRYQLLKAIKDANPGCIMYGVGDDWQSIYRFTGSDLSLLSQFDKHFGVTATSKIETTYRFAKPLLDIGSEFVMANPHQIKKQLCCQDANKLTEVFFHYYEKTVEQNSYNEDVPDVKELPQTANEAVVLALDSLAHGNCNQVMLLGRYSFDIKLLASSDFIITNTDDATMIKSVKYPDIDIRFLTVHSAKGLEADSVVLLNCSSDYHGFPSEVADDPLLTMMMSEPDKMEFGEERRLFYVAMTRARKALHLIIDNEATSPFVTEVDFEEKAYQDICPLCNTGNRVLRKSRKGTQFWGCSNFPYGCTWTQKYIPPLSDEVAIG